MRPSLRPGHDKLGDRSRSDRFPLFRSGWEPRVSAEGWTAFWSNGYAYGSVKQVPGDGKTSVTFSVLRGEVSFRTFVLKGFGKKDFAGAHRVRAGEALTFVLNRDTRNASKKG